MNITTRTTLTEIRDALENDGYAALVGRAAEIKKAANAGCLVWNAHHIITTDASRINARPN